MLHRLLFIGLLLLITAGAALFRVGGIEPLKVAPLAERPMHTDEAVQADRFREYWEKGVYQYDPHEYHGPTLNYATLAAMKLWGHKTFAQSHENTYRSVPLVVGVALILLAVLVADGLGKIATLVGAVLLAISPAMVFYSRYYIHELLLVFFTLGAIGAGWRFVRGGKLVWAIVCGACVGLMHATKETWIIQGGAMGGAVVLTMLWGRIVDGRAMEWRRWIGPRVIVAGLLAAVVVTVVLFSSLFTHARGPLDSLLTYKIYWERGTAPSLHEHPWYYYLQVLSYWRVGRYPVWSEGFIVGLAGVGIIAALWRRRRLAEESGEGPQKSPTERASGTGSLASSLADATGREQGRSPGLVRFLAFYTMLTLVGYSIVKYKTPWCMLGFLHGLILLAGVGAVAVVRRMPHWSLKLVMVALLGVGAWQLFDLAQRTNSTRFAAHTANPYVYAHPLMKVKELGQRMEELAKVSPEGHRMLICMVSSPADCWPLPWYLRHFERVGYWTDAPPPIANVPVYIVAPEKAALLNERVQTEYKEEYYGLRPTILLKAYTRPDLFEAMVEARSRPGH